jgi:hypothetical protein
MSLKLIINRPKQLMDGIPQNWGTIKIACEEQDCQNMEEFVFELSFALEIFGRGNNNVTMRELLPKSPLVAHSIAHKMCIPCVEYELNRNGLYLGRKYYTADEMWKYIGNEQYVAV